jgi:hypothetical protein
MAPLKSATGASINFFRLTVILVLHETSNQAAFFRARYVPLLKCQQDQSAVVATRSHPIRRDVERSAARKKVLMVLPFEK